MRTRILILGILLVPLFFIFRVIGQEFTEVKGVIHDHVSEHPLPFAQIGVKNFTLGTVSNEEGRFVIRIPYDRLEDTLMIRYLGYETILIPVTKMASGEANIKLRPATYQLAEVEVVGYTPQEVIRQAVTHIPVNYGKDSVILTAFVRVQKMYQNRLVEFTEAIVSDLKDGYYHYPRAKLEEKSNKSNVPDLLKGRVISDTSIVNALDEAGKDARCLGCYFIEDLVEFYPHTVLDEHEFRYYQYAMEELNHPEMGKIFHITFDQRDGIKETLWQGELFIESSSFAILSIMVKPSLKGFETFEKRKALRTYTIKGKPFWIKEMPLGQTTVTYTKQGEYWRLGTIRNNYRITYTYPPTGERLVTGYISEVVVTDEIRDPMLIRHFAGSKTIGVGQRWDQVVGETDENFWQGFNYLPIEEQLQKEISRMHEFRNARMQ
jgi:hypothetical protein